MDNILIPMIDDSETTVTVTVSKFEGVRLNSSTDGHGGGERDVTQKVLGLAYVICYTCNMGGD